MHTHAVTWICEVLLTAVILFKFHARELDLLSLTVVVYVCYYHSRDLLLTLWNLPPWPAERRFSSPLIGCRQVKPYVITSWFEFREFGCVWGRVRVVQAPWRERKRQLVWRTTPTLGVMQRSMLLWFWKETTVQ